MKIQVKNLLPNPFRNINAYPIDREKVKQLRNSIRETTFWDNILARTAPKNGRYEIAYGHHRLVAIKEELGDDKEVDIPVRNLSDENMLKIMANENMQEWSTDWRIIVETVRQTKKFLETHLEIVEQYKDMTKRRDIGEGTISRFLGKNWSNAMIENALAIIADKEGQDIISPPSRRNNRKIDISTLAQISSIKDKQAKKHWLEQAAEKDISKLEMQEIARFERDPILATEDKQSIRENITEDRIRGQQQIRDQVESAKISRLHETEKTGEDKKKEELKDFIVRIDEVTINLKNKLTALKDQLTEYPETVNFLPPEETAKFSRSLTTLLLIIGKLLDITRSRTEGRKEALSEGNRENRKDSQPGS